MDYGGYLEVKVFILSDSGDKLNEMVLGIEFRLLNFSF